MNKKNIRKMIESKMNKWVNSITDEDLVQRLRQDIIVTGGCITSMYLNENVNDYDIYISDKKTLMMLAQYYCDRYNDIEYKTARNNDINSFQRAVVNIENNRIEIYYNKTTLEDYEGYQNISIKTDDCICYPIIITPNAITITEGIQIITRFYGTPNDIHSNFDFVHATNYWTYKDGLVLREEALESILSKQLRYIGSKYPLASVIRTKKFIKRGWNITAGQYLKMLLQLNKMNLMDIRTLKDQLEGVDATYFIQFIEAIKDRKDVDDTFMSEIIDKIFED